MKRSEMIKKLSDFLFYNDTEEAAKSNADRLLTYLEYEGMLPPSINGVVETEALEDGSIVVYPWKWEPEDETK